MGNKDSKGVPDGPGNKVRSKNNQDENDLSPVEEEEDAKETEELGSLVKPVGKSSHHDNKSGPKRKNTLLSRAEQYRSSVKSDSDNTPSPESKREPVTQAMEEEIKEQKSAPLSSAKEDVKTTSKTSNEKNQAKGKEKTPCEHKGQLTREGSLMEMGTNQEMWQRIVEHSLMGSKLLLKTAVCNMVTGTIFAHHPCDFQPTVEQIKSLGVALFHPSSLAETGIYLADDFFQYQTAQIGYLLMGIAEDGETRVLIIAGKSCALMGVYNRREDDVMKLLTEMVEYFRSQNEF